MVFGCAVGPGVKRCLIWTSLISDVPIGTSLTIGVKNHPSGSLTRFFLLTPGDTVEYGRRTDGEGAR